MGFQKIIKIQTVTTLVGQDTFTAPLELGGGTNLSVVGAVTLGQSASFTVAAGALASAVVQDLTYTSTQRDAGINSLNIVYLAGGVAGSEVVTFTYPTILQVLMQSGVSTANQIRTAVAGSSAAFFVTAAVTGTGSNPQNSQAGVTMSGGITTGVTLDPNSALRANSTYQPNWESGTGGTFSSTATLPAGLATNTTYYLFASNDFSQNNYVPFATYAAFLAGTPRVAITDFGTSGSTITFTPTAFLFGSATFQISPDLVTWTDYGNAVAINANFLLLYIEEDCPGLRWIRLKYKTTQGSSYTVTSTIMIKGDI